MSNLPCRSSENSYRFILFERIWIMDCWSFLQFCYWIPNIKCWSTTVKENEGGPSLIQRISIWISIRIHLIHISPLFRCSNHIRYRRSRNCRLYWYKIYRLKSFMYSIHYMSFTFLVDTKYEQGLCTINSKEVKTLLIQKVRF